MSNVFFLSYARPREAAKDTEPLIRQFHADLQSKLADHVSSGGSGGPFGFIDRCDIEAGSADWVQRLTDAMIQHPIGVVLMSPDYLDSSRPWCRWECKFLAERNDALDRLQPALPDGPPKALLLLNWGNPSDSGMPKDFNWAGQRVGESIAANDGDDIAAVKQVCERGLRNVMELASAGDLKGAAAYVRFVQCLARHIAKQWQRWATVVSRGFDLPSPPAFDGVGWVPAVPSSSGQPARPAVATRRMVYVVYLAAPPGDINDDKRRKRHELRGESDWQPFGDSQHVDGFVDDLRDCKVEKWQFSFFRQQMQECLAQAGAIQPVLFVVDPWSACQRDDYRLALADYLNLASAYGTFSCPLVIWNPEDEASDELRGDYEQRVEVIFGRDRWEPVNDARQFLERLQHVVGSLQNKIRMARTSHRPANSPPPPRISPNNKTAGCAPGSAS